ncbi:hypothetical protein [Mucilaginibacter gossypii]|uniref:Uncharacterized protein n=1 Tax=Mucilaginibacter gossypii TaxID=551996 RepID=A0A1G8NKG0_9SPHI|nr:hypothetical protein [Mucilaginibacter gossypii]SDI80597.1 hypothetical protein SAMN05192573_1349 [Mucilaginibacter gossypii]
MEHLLNNTTWKQYLCAALAAAVSYYAFIAWKYYRHEIRQLIARLSAKADAPEERPAVLQYPTEKIEPEQVNPAVNLPEEAYSQKLPFSGTASDLARQLRQCIYEAAEEPFAPQLLIPALRKILHDYPDVAATTDREKINALVVSECDNTGTALLSEGEVDQWWSA